MIRDGLIDIPSAYDWRRAASRRHRPPPVRRSLAAGRTDARALNGGGPREVLEKRPGLRAGPNN